MNDSRVGPLVLCGLVFMVLVLLLEPLPSAWSGLFKTSRALLTSSSTPLRLPARWVTSSMYSNSSEWSLAGGHERRVIVVLAENLGPPVAGIDRPQWSFENPSNDL
jgi:hypothetical protein